MLIALWHEVMIYISMFQKEFQAHVYHKDISQPVVGFFFVCIMSSFSKCYHLQCEEFPSVFLIVLWIEPCSFLKKQQKKRGFNFFYAFFISQLSSNFFYKTLCVYLCCYWLVSCSHDGLLVYFLHYAASMCW